MMRKLKNSIAAGAMLAGLLLISGSRTVSAAPVPPDIPQTPEPTYEALLGAGMVGMGVVAVRRRSRRKQGGE